MASVRVHVLFEGYADNHNRSCSGARLIEFWRAGTVEKYDPTRVDGNFYLAFESSGARRFGE